MDGVERRRAEVERHRENSARPAESYAKFETFGQGFIEFEERVDFGLTFIEEPYVSYGAKMDLDELGELLGLDAAVTPPVPMTTGMVTDWDLDDRGFYVGAWVGVRTYFPPVDAVASDLDVHIYHHFIFTAIAIKDIPLDVRD